MQIAARIRQVRLEHFLSLEELAAKAGLSRNRLASIENGQDIPEMQTFDSLAEALGVPLQSLFYGKSDLNLTPWLTPRPTLQQLTDERYWPAPEPDTLQEKA
jgi:transcriptional regulator with XRE-family HTH domain